MIHKLNKKNTAAANHLILTFNKQNKKNFSVLLCFESYKKCLVNHENV